MMNIPKRRILGLRLTNKGKQVNFRTAMMYPIKVSLNDEFKGIGYMTYDSRNMNMSFDMLDESTKETLPEELYHVDIDYELGMLIVMPDWSM